MKVTWSRIIHPGVSAASLTFTHLELLTHEEYSPWKRMWFNHITVRSACMSHASRLLVSKWITVFLNRSQFACWHDWISSTNKQTSRSCPWTFPAECQLQVMCDWEDFRVFTRNEEWKSLMPGSTRVFYLHLDLFYTFAAPLNYHHIWFLLDWVKYPYKESNALRWRLPTFLMDSSHKSCKNFGSLHYCVAEMVEGQWWTQLHRFQRLQRLQMLQMVKCGNWLCNQHKPRHSANWLSLSMHCIERLTQILWFLGFQVSWCYQTSKSHDSPTADH